MRLVVRVMSVALVVGVLAGCGGSSPTFPAAARSSFLSSCEQGTPANACTCMFDYIQSHVSVQEFKNAVAELKSGTTPTFVTAAALSCRKKLGAGTGGGTTT